MKADVGIELRQRLEQKLILTPQLKIQLDILVQPLIELEQKIREEIEVNPFLEELPKASKEKSNEYEEIDYNYYGIYEGSVSYNDDEWDEKYSDFWESIPSRPNVGDDIRIQIESLPEDEQPIAEKIYHSLDEKGFLSKGLKEIADELKSEKGESVSEDYIETVRRKFMNFDPPGMASFDIFEFYEFQLSLYSFDEVTVSIFKKIFSELRKCSAGITVFSHEDIHKKISEEFGYEKVRDVLKVFAPYPLYQYDTYQNSPLYLKPDIMVKVNREDGTYTISLNTDYPRIRVIEKYKNLIRRKDTNNFIKEKYLKAKSIVEAVEKRREALLKTCETIFEIQKDFIFYGKDHIKPMTLEDVGEKINFHPSTISRTIRGKYVETPYGLFQLKDFFKGGIKSDSGERILKSKIHSEIKRVIDNEDKMSPLSDSEIASILAKSGVRIARRTIAKYRKEMNIPSVEERRKGI